MYNINQSSGHGPVLDPGHLYVSSGHPSAGPSKEDTSEVIMMVVYYAIAALVFIFYANGEFGTGGAILYSLFWPFGIGYELMAPLF